ncbi:MAG: hypothetical protein ACHQ52_09970 [Candidatus Eisenbacteria bacterium]
MKRHVGWLVALAACLVVAVAFAHDEKDKTKPMAGMSTAKPQSLTGEVVDMGCYMAHEATGEKHLACATKCIANGMPMGLLTTDGKLYLITLDHDNADPYNKCKDWAAKHVTLTGSVSERAGMRSIDVTAAQLAAAK